MENLWQDWEALAWAVGGLAGAVVIGLVAHALFFAAVRRVTARVPGVLIFQGALLRRSKRPLQLLFPLVSVFLFLPLIAEGLPPEVMDVVEDVLYILVVVALAWLLIQSAAAMDDAVQQRFDLDAEDNLQARKVVTQTRILRRIFVVIICVLALALILMRYEGFRELGAGILASAGIAGIIVGFAAQRTLGNLLAGIQIALTQPIRVDDVVIVEGEFGWVEEITLTYVVVRVWDLRRIVLPISYFIEKPFQNWTRQSAELLGTVFLYVDYTVPVEDIRQAHRRIVEASDRWDGQACALQVTDAKERTLELRCLQSASSAPRLFELRCHVREALIGYIQENYPEALPRLRAEMRGPMAEAAARGDGAES